MPSGLHDQQQSASYADVRVPNGAGPAPGLPQSHVAAEQTPGYPGVASAPQDVVAAPLSTTPPGLGLDQEMSAVELNMLLKFFSSMGELPKIDMGEAHNRGERLTMWVIAVETILKTQRRVVMDWWQWCYGNAKSTYQRWLHTNILQRNSLTVGLTTPRFYETIENYFLPRILAIIPSKLKDSIMQEKVYGIEATVTEVMFKLLKQFQPGSMDEQDSLERLLKSPNPCRDPQAALRELRRWFAGLKRAVEVGMTLPGLEPLYRGARSIYSGVFEGDDFGLRLRWTNVEQMWGFPHSLSHEGLRAINQFAESELGAMIVHGRGSANTSLSLTETQKARLKGEREAEKASKGNTRKGGDAGGNSTANSVMVDGQRHSASTSVWATECEAWSKQGHL